MYQPNADVMEGLSIERIQRLAPSVFAEAPHASRSSKYVFIPTKDVLLALYEAGFRATNVMQARTRREGYENFVKHFLELRRVEQLGIQDPETFMIGFENDHAGGASWKFFKMVWRQICTNGLHAWVRGEDEVRIRHTGNPRTVINNVVDSTLRIIDESDTTMSLVQGMKSVMLNRDEQVELVRAGMHARFGKLYDQEHPERSLTVYKPEDFLRTRRPADRQDTSIWTTLNVAQEDMIDGGIVRYLPDGERKSTRKVNGIDQRREINQDLWKGALDVMRSRLQA